MSSALPLNVKIPSNRDQNPPHTLRPIRAASAGLGAAAAGANANTNSPSKSLSQRLDAAGAGNSSTTFGGGVGGGAAAATNADGNKAGGFLKAGGAGAASYFNSMFNPSGAANLGGNKNNSNSGNAAGNAGGTKGPNATPSSSAAADSKDAATLLATLVATDKQRAKAVEVYQEQVLQFLSTEVSSAIADLYLVQAEVDVHYFQISRVLDKGERTRKAAIAAGMAAAATRKTREGGGSAAAVGGAADTDASSSSATMLQDATDVSNEAFKALLKFKAKGITELKATIKLILQSTTPEFLENNGTQAMRSILTTQIAEQNQLEDGSYQYRQRSAAHATYTNEGGGAAATTRSSSAKNSRANTSVGDHNTNNSKDSSSSQRHTIAKANHYNPYQFGAKTQAHLAKCYSYTLNPKVRVGASSHLLNAGKENPLLFMDVGGSVAAAASAAAAAAGVYGHNGGNATTAALSTHNLNAMANDPALEQLQQNATAAGMQQQQQQYGRGGGAAAAAVPRLSLFGNDIMSSAQPITAASNNNALHHNQQAAAAAATAGGGGNGTLWFDETTQEATINSRSTNFVPAELTPITLVQLQKLLLQKLNELIRIAHVAASLGIVGKTNLPEYLKPMLFGAGPVKNLGGGAVVAGGSSGVVSSPFQTTLGGLSASQQQQQLASSPPKALQRGASSRGGFIGGRHNNNSNNALLGNTSNGLNSLAGTSSNLLLSQSGGVGGGGYGVNAMPPTATTILPAASGGVCRPVIPGVACGPILVPYPFAPITTEVTLQGTGTKKAQIAPNPTITANDAAIADPSTADLNGKAIKDSARVAFATLAIDTAAVIRRCQIPTRDVMGAPFDTTNTHSNNNRPMPVDSTVPFASSVTDAVMVYHSPVPTPKQPDALFADDEILLAAAAAGVILPSAILEHQQRKMQQQMMNHTTASGAAQSPSKGGRGLLASGGNTQLLSTSSDAAALLTSAGNNTTMQQQMESSTVNGGMNASTASTAAALKATASMVVLAGEEDLSTRIERSANKYAVANSHMTQVTKLKTQLRSAGATGRVQSASSMSRTMSPRTQSLAALPNTSEYDKRTAAALLVASSSPANRKDGGGVIGGAAMHRVHSYGANTEVSNGEDAESHYHGHGAAAKVVVGDPEEPLVSVTIEESKYFENGDDDDDAADDERTPNAKGRRPTTNLDDIDSDDEDERGLMERSKARLAEKQRRLLGKAPPSSFMARSKNLAASGGNAADSANNNNDDFYADTTAARSASANNNKFKIVSMPIKAHLSKNPAIDALVKKGVLPPRPTASTQSRGTSAAASGAIASKRAQSPSSALGAAAADPNGTATRRLLDRGSIVSPAISSAAMAEARTSVVGLTQGIGAAVSSPASSRPACEGAPDPSQHGGVLLAPLSPPRIQLRPVDRFEPPANVQRSALDKVTGAKRLPMRAESPSFALSGGWYKQQGSQRHDIAGDPADEVPAMVMGGNEEEGLNSDAVHSPANTMGADDVDDVSWVVNNNSTSPPPATAAARRRNSGTNSIIVSRHKHSDSPLNGSAVVGGGGEETFSIDTTRARSARKNMSSADSSSLPFASGRTQQSSHGGKNRATARPAAAGGASPQQQQRAPSPSVASGKEVFELRAKLHTAEVAIEALQSDNYRLQQKLEIYQTVEDHLGAANEVGRFVELGSSVAAAFLLQGLRRSGQSLRPPAQQAQAALAIKNNLPFYNNNAPPTVAAAAPSPTSPGGPVAVSSSPHHHGNNPPLTARTPSPAARRRMSLKGSSPLGITGGSIAGGLDDASSGPPPPPPIPPPTAPQLVNQFLTAMLSDLTKVCGGDKLATFPAIAAHPHDGGGFDSHAASFGTSDSPTNNNAKPDPDATPAARAAAIFGPAYAASVSMVPNTNSSGSPISPPPALPQGRVGGKSNAAAANAAPAIAVASVGLAANGPAVTTGPSAQGILIGGAMPKDVQQALGGAAAVVGGAPNLAAFTAFGNGAAPAGSSTATAVPSGSASVVSGSASPSNTNGMVRIPSNKSSSPLFAPPTATMPYLYPTQILVELLMKECGPIPVNPNANMIVGGGGFVSNDHSVKSSARGGPAAIHRVPLSIGDGSTNNAGDRMVVNPDGSVEVLSAAQQQQRQQSSSSSSVLPTVDSVTRILNYSGGAFAGLLAELPLGWVSNALMSNATNNIKVARREEKQAAGAGGMTSRNGGGARTSSPFGGFANNSIITVERPPSADGSGEGGGGGESGNNTRASSSKGGGANNRNAMSSVGGGGYNDQFLNMRPQLNIPALPLSALTSSAEERFSMLEKVIVFGAHNPSQLPQQQQGGDVGAMSASLSPRGGGGPLGSNMALRRGSSSASMLMTTARGVGQTHLQQQQQQVSVGGAAAAAVAQSSSIDTARSPTHLSPFTAHLTAANANNNNGAGGTNQLIVDNEDEMNLQQYGASPARPQPPKTGAINVEAILTALQNALAVSNTGGGKKGKRSNSSAANDARSSASSTKGGGKKGTAAIDDSVFGGGGNQRSEPEEHQIVRRVILEAVASQPHPLDCLSPRSVKIAKDVKEILLNLGGDLPAGGRGASGAGNDAAAVVAGLLTPQQSGLNPPPNPLASSSSLAATANSFGVASGPSAAVIKNATKTFVGLSAAQQEARVTDWINSYNANPHLRNIIKVQNALIELLLTSLLKEETEMPMMGQ